MFRGQRSVLSTQVSLSTLRGPVKDPPAAGQERPIDALRRSAPHAWLSPVRFFPLPPLPTSKMAAGGADQVRGTLPGVCGAGVDLVTLSGLFSQLRLGLGIEKGPGHNSRNPGRTLRQARGAAPVRRGLRAQRRRGGGESPDGRAVKTGGGVARERGVACAGPGACG